MKTTPAKLLLCALLMGLQPLRAADPVFSGPLQGEKITPFKVLELTGDGAGKERDPVADHAGAADHYGTEYSRKVGRAFVEELQREAK